MVHSSEAIFHEARALSGEVREAYLKGACGSDVSLRTKVEALLKADAEAANFLETVQPIAPDAETVPERPGTRSARRAALEHPGQMIGRYKLLQMIGEGGFGSVWMAEQREPVRRRVALKIIKLGMDTKQVIARFEAERQALAMMDHPNIAKVLDAGSTETGRPFFVMELVKGVPILDYCDTERLDTRQRLELFKNICHAIQHAHQKGIIHRDIKPSNVMITLHDSVPVPKVIDFGIAKATNQELTDKTLFTQHRQMIGTPAYMSPEQAEMSGLDIDTRSDIYSLGVLLYELLTGTTPFNPDELLSMGFAEMMRIIREAEPHKPSTRLSTLGEIATRTAAQRNIDVKRLGLVLRGDLDWIVMKCLEKDRTRRYETANGLAADIDRHLRDEPVVAGPPSQVYRLRKFVRRNRTGVLAATVVTVGLLLAVSAVGVAFVQIGFERDRAQAAEEKSRALRTLFGGGQVSLAILPLENRTKDPEYDYLANGVTTFLTNDLHRISALHLMSGSSVRSAIEQTGSKASLRTIADELNVDGVLTGSVEWRGDRVHMTIQLIHALTNQNLWERKYNEDFENLQAMQNAVSRDIITELQLELTDDERLHLDKEARPIDREAQAACMKGYHLMRRLTRKTLDRAIEYFDKAIAIDPEYAVAHAGRAMAWRRLVNDFMAPLDSMPHAKESALRALKIDDTLAEAHSALGYVSLEFDWDWDTAEREFKTAIELDPDAASGYVGYAMFLAAMNRPDEAMECIDRAFEIDPFVLVTTGDAIPLVEYVSGEIERAIMHCEEAIDLNPRVWKYYVWLSLSLAELGDLDAAIEAAEEGHRIVQESLQRDPDDNPAPLMYAALGGVYARAGREDDAREALATIEKIGLTYFTCPYETASIHVALGEIEQAISKMCEAIDVRSGCIPWLGVDPRLDSLRAHERFPEILDHDERVKDLLERTGWEPSP